MATDFERYVEACNYPGVLNEAAVTRHLGIYLNALKIERKIVRLTSAWRLQDHPSLQRSVNAILDDFAKRRPRAALDAGAAGDAGDTRAARAALDARDARAALDALAARDALAALDAGAAGDAGDATAFHRFASWCIQSNGWWWWRWDLSWMATYCFGARQLKSRQVEAWSAPLLEAYIAGCWYLYWTDDTLFWVAKPILHHDAAPNTRRLHNSKHAALESDVENLYFWHGVLVPAFVIVRPDWITLKHIGDEWNAEVRRVMIERYKHGEEIHGAAAYMRDAGGQSVDHDERFGTLWQRNVKDDEPIIVLEVVNSTREPTGEWKHYWLRVPPAMKTAREAVAWTFGMSAGEYAPMVET